MEKIYVYDTTLRDGTQGEGVAFSSDDKLKIVRMLDDLGVDYIEAGIPASNPKDRELFEKISELELKHAKIVAFGSTHRFGVDVKDDSAIEALIDAKTPVVAIFGKAWDLHVSEVLHASLDENILVISDTVSYLKSHGKEVVFDAEHFFDGYKNNKEYALKVLIAAKNAGADTLCLCDTNGATFPDKIAEITKEVTETIKDIKIAIHCHNDVGVAVANTLMAVINGGACQIQGTINGLGERCGNANLCTIIPNLQLKCGYNLIPEDKLRKLKSVSRHIYELANIVPDERKPYVGNMAFTHKGGMHIDAVLKNPATFEHINPEAVGNERRLLMSEMSGRAMIYEIIKKINPDISKDSEIITELLEDVKKLENEGYVFEGGESSFELMIMKKLGYYKPQFELEQFKVISIAPTTSKTASAMIKISVDGNYEITAAEGDGPVNALDKALRKALYRFYPELKETRLIDFKVRVLDGMAGTAALTRVLIETTDGHNNWNTVGVSEDIIEASWQGIVDSIEYYLLDKKIKGDKKTGA